MSWEPSPGSTLTLATAAAVNWSTIESSLIMTSTVPSAEGWALYRRGQCGDEGEESAGLT